MDSSRSGTQGDAQDELASLNRHLARIADERYRRLLEILQEISGSDDDEVLDAIRDGSFFWNDVHVVILRHDEPADQLILYFNAGVPPEDQMAAAYQAVLSENMKAVNPFVFGLHQRTRAITARVNVPMFSIDPDCRIVIDLLKRGTDLVATLVRQYRLTAE